MRQVAIKQGLLTMIAIMAMVLAGCTDAPSSANNTPTETVK